MPTGKPLSPEHRAAISASKRGKARPPELVERIGTILRGRKRIAEVRYGSAHDRVRVARGLPHEHGCVMCGERPAEDWALDHELPTKAFREGNHRGRILRFSLDVEDYLPMCKLCHRRFDA